MKCSSLAVAKTLILLGDDGAAPIDHAGAGRVDGASRCVTLHSRWRRRDAVDAASSLGGHLANVPHNPLARLDCRSCSAAGWAETRTPLRHRRDTSQIPPAARAPPSPAALSKLHETPSPSRAHHPASARGQTTRALPWEDATARFLQLGFEVARRPVRARELPLFASVARFDPRQAGQTLNHGFPRWPVQKPSFRKNQQSAARRRLLSAAETPLFPPEKRGGISVDRKTRTFPNLCGYHTWLSPKRLGFESR